MIELPDHLDECLVLEPREEFDKAIIGYIEVGPMTKVLYDFEKVIDILCQTMTRDEAIDHFYYNMKSVGVAYFNELDGV